MMAEIRSDQVETGDAEVKAAQIVIDAPAAEIFNIVANPAKHFLFDGSKTVKGKISGPDRLFLGAKFGMHMKIKIPYRITNTCVEFEENKKIAWRHLGRHIWRYEFREISENQTEVTESFDGRKALSQWYLNKIGAYRFNQVAVLKTLVRLKKLAEANSEPS
jgi:hypothetical protein